MTLDVRADFPAAQTVLESPITGEKLPLVFMDHAASTHPPRQVLDEHMRFLSRAYANVHRGAHHLSVVSTEAFEDVRLKAHAFVGARRDHEVVFSTNTTTALNMAAHLVQHLPGKTLVTCMEHHSNDLPHRARGEVDHVDVAKGGNVDLEDYQAKLDGGDVKLVAVTAASNVTGIRPPLAEMIDRAHEAGARVLVDGAQALAHLPLDLDRIGRTGGPDFFAAAGHKAYAPFGAAFLVAPKDLLEEAPPFYPGGGTVSLVSETEIGWTTGAEKHEGGTPNVPGIVALGAAIDYLRGHDMERVRAHELELLPRLLDGLRDVPGVRVLGDAPLEDRVGVATFIVDGVPHGLVSTVLDNEFGIATRNGCFCAHPYLTRLLGLPNLDKYRERLRQGGSTRDPDFPGAVRASLGIYNHAADVERLLEAVERIARKDWKGDYEHTDLGWMPRNAMGVARPVASCE